MKVRIIMNNSDRRVIKTKSAIKDAMKSLMVKYNDYMDITIKELCDKANINRRTFYLHYNAIDDVLIDIEEDFIQDFFQRTKEYDHIIDLEPVIGAFFDLHEENPVYQKLVLSPTQDYLREILRSRTVSKLDENDNLKRIRHLNNDIQGMIEQYFHMSVVSIYREWIRQHRKMKKEEVVKLAASLIKNGISSLVK